MLPASALMLFRPTVAPARPCRVPREVREFMALALELAVVPAGGAGWEGVGLNEGMEGGEEDGSRMEVKRESRRQKSKHVIQFRDGGQSSYKTYFMYIAKILAKMNNLTERQSPAPSSS